MMARLMMRRCDEYFFFSFFLRQGCVWMRKNLCKSHFLPLFSSSLFTVSERARGKRREWRRRRKKEVLLSKMLMSLVQDANCWIESTCTRCYCCCCCSSSHCFCSFSLLFSSTLLSLFQFILAFARTFF